MPAHTVQGVEALVALRTLKVRGAATALVISPVAAVHAVLSAEVDEATRGRAGVQHLTVGADEDHRLGPQTLEVLVTLTHGQGRIWMVVVDILGNEDIYRVKYLATTRRREKVHQLHPTIH